MKVKDRLPVPLEQLLEEIYIDKSAEYRKRHSQEDPHEENRHTRQRHQR